MGYVRLAEPADTEAIVTIIRSGFQADLLAYNIAGCEGYEAYLRDAIIAQQSGGSSLFVVYCDQQTPLAVAEFRSTAERVFLNHIYTAPSVRGEGIGSELLWRGLTLAHDLHQDELELDVFIDNVRAWDWYQKLGLAPVYEHAWMELNLAPRSKAAHWWKVGDLPQADRVHLAYGFSQFRLVTESSIYTVGRIGAHLYRSPAPEILEDEDAIGALRLLDSSRKLLYIGEKSEISPEITDRMKMLTRSQRLAGRLDQAMSYLKTRSENSN